MSTRTRSSAASTFDGKREQLFKEFQANYFLVEFDRLEECSKRAAVARMIVLLKSLNEESKFTDTQYQQASALRYNLLGLGEKMKDIERTIAVAEEEPLEDGRRHVAPSAPSASKSQSQAAKKEKKNKGTKLDVRMFFTDDRAQETALASEAPL